jgi:Zn-dependent protease with chaperone function
VTAGVSLALLSAVAAVAFACSLLCAAALFLSRRWLRGLAPAAQSRVLFAVALAPALVSAALLSAMVFDLAVRRCDVHRCLLHGSAGLSPLVAGPALLLAIRFGRQGWAALDALRRSRVIARALESVASPGGAVSRIVPVDEPQAFVIGLFRPRMYLSQGLLRTTDPRDLESVMEHERSHIRRRDPLRRLVASLGLAFHLPGVASAIDRRLAATQESAADAAAARALGDPPRIAEALVRLARLRVARPPLAVGVLGSDLEFRVRELLSPATRPDRPAPMLLIAVATTLFAAALLVADPIHTAFESLVRLLAG